MGEIYTAPGPSTFRPRVGWWPTLHNENSAIIPARVPGADYYERRHASESAIAPCSSWNVRGTA